MASLAIRKGENNRQVVRQELREAHEAQPRVHLLRHIEPDRSATLEELQKRIAKVRLTSADRDYLSEQWHRAGNGVFFDALAASATT